MSNTKFYFEFKSSMTGGPQKAIEIMSANLMVEKFNKFV